MLRLLGIIILAGGVTAAAFVILPSRVRQEIASFLDLEKSLPALEAIPEKIGAAKDGVQSKIESLILPPEKQREKLLVKLQNNLAEIQKENLTPETEKIIEESSKLVEEIKNKNNEIGLLQGVAQKILGNDKRASGTRPQYFRPCPDRSSKNSKPGSMPAAAIRKNFLFMAMRH